jgi:eukaryotic-like serine/threonine-protein kinase
MKLCPKCQKQFSDDANFCPVDAARLVPLESRTTTADSIASKFEVGDRLGGSRTGAVHRATDKASGHAAAVKIIAPAVVALPGLAQRLERELKQLERVQSAGVAKVLASGKRGDDSWVALELVDGAQTLAAAISARGPIAAEQAAHLIEVVGEALIEAAQVGVVHRDLAPKNVLFAGDEVKLINFSLPVPTNDKVPGVAEFVAPEQLDGKPVDQRSNLYSLGALYYFVLTGQVIQLDDGGAIKAPSALAPVPAAIDAVILRALDRSPTRRFLTVRQLLDEVGRIAHGEVVDLKSTQPMGRAGRPKAELVQTLLGIRGPMEGTPAMHALSPERSPWAPPATAPPNPPAMQPAAPILPTPMVTAPGVAPPVALAAAPVAGPGVAAAVAPVAAVPVAAPVAAPVVAAPVAPAVAPPVVARPQVAAPILGSGKKAKPGEDPKGKFRETMWFKKGELDAQAAQAAAEEHATTGADPATDKADSLPIDERYKDDGTLSRSDKEKYSLRTGATMANPVMRDAGASASLSNKVSEDALIGEMKSGRNRIVLLIVVGIVVVALIILAIVR